MERSRFLLLSALSTAAVLALSTAVVAAEEDEEMEEGGGLAIAAASATITVDGDASDWADIPATTLTLEQFDKSELPQDQQNDINFDPVDPMDVDLKIANDDENIYLLVQADMPYFWSSENYHHSPSVSYEWLIEPDASVHMGAEDTDLEESTGMVDIWHWELNCGVDTLVGGQGVAGGNDEACNFDDEYSTTPSRREDDGDGDLPNDAAENSFTGMVTHSSGNVDNADGTWTFEMSRPLQTGDPQDAQFASGETAHLVLAVWNPAENAEDGWSDSGHLTNSEQGWIEVTLN